MSWIGAIFFGVLAVRYALALLKPGTLTISPMGIRQDLPWRSRHLRWADIEKVELRGSAMVLIHPATERPIRLFGWELSPRDLYEVIERERPTQTPR
jgi:hypothetical protein